MKRKASNIKQFILIGFTLLFGITSSAQIFTSSGGRPVNAVSVGEPNKPNGQVIVRNAPGTANRLAAMRTAYANAGIPNNIISNPRFLGNGAFNVQISDMWATKQTAQKVRTTTAKIPGNVIVVTNANLNSLRARIASNQSLSFVFRGWVNVGWPIAVGSNTNIWVDGTLSYNGFDAPRTATGAAFTPRPSKYDGVFNIRPSGAFKDEPGKPANKTHNNNLLNSKFKRPNGAKFAIKNVKIYGTRRGQILVGKGLLPDDSVPRQILPKVNGITVMNASNITIEGVTIKNAIQGIFLSVNSFNVNFNNNFIDNTLYRAMHLKGAYNGSGFGSIKNNLITNSKFDGIDVDSFAAGFKIEENVVIGARDRLLIWTEIDAFNNIINNNVGIMLNAALEGKPNGNAGRGAYRESGTEAVRNPTHPNFNPRDPVKYKGNRNNQWLNNHSFYAENEDDAFIMRKNRFIQFNTITFRNNHVWTTKPNIRKHNPKSAFTNDVFYLTKSAASPVVPRKGNAGVVNIPGTIQSENAPNVIKPLQVVTLNGGRKGLGYIKNGLFADYSVNVAKAGTYKIDAYGASAGAGGRVRVKIGSRTAVVNISVSGNWTTSGLRGSATVFLDAGNHTMRTTFEKNPGTAGNPFLYNLDGFVFKAVAGSQPVVPKKGPPAPAASCNWKEHGGRGQALDIGSNGSHLYVIGTNSVLYKSNGNAWSAIDKTNKKLKRIDVSANGDVWAIARDNKVWHFKLNERRWISRGGQGIDIGVGKGVVYILDVNGKVRKFISQGTYANPLPGSGKRIDVDGGGNPSVVGGDNKLYRWTGKNWWHPQQSSALRLQDIGMSPSSNVVTVATTNNQIYASVNSGAYKQLASGQATQVTMSSGGVLWLINPQRKIYSKGCINSGAKILNTIANTLDVQVYPNPISAGASINLKMPSGESATITTSLSDLSGKVVYTNTITNAEGDQQLSVSTSGLSKGLYLLKVSTGSRTKIEKVVIK